VKKHILKSQNIQELTIPSSVTTINTQAISSFKDLKKVIDKLQSKAFEIFASSLEGATEYDKPDYKKYRQSLIRTCSDFTGYNNQQSFSRSEIGYKSFDEVLDRVYFLSQMNLKQLSIETSLNRYKLNQMSDLEHVVEDQKIELNKLIGVKFTARRLAGNIKRRILNGK